MWWKEVRVTAVLLATLGLLGFIHYNSPGEAANMWMVYGVILSGVSFMLIGRSFTTGGMEGIIRARNGK